MNSLAEYRPDTVTVRDGKVLKIERKFLSDDKEIIIALERRADRLIFKYGHGELQHVRIGSILEVSGRFYPQMRDEVRKLFELEITTVEAIQVICQERKTKIVYDEAPKAKSKR